jgi:membrane protein DedA with SNARE-associated domain
VQAVLDWLTSLPSTALYAVLALAAAIENIVPPAPSDTVVAFGSFLAARGEASLPGAFLATWGGNIAGAMLVYFAGRRFGARRLEARLGEKDGAARRHVSRMYGKYGLLGLALSRFIPGVRALVPPVAGALKLPAWTVLFTFAVPSALWYGAITVLAYRLGKDWDQLSRAVAQGGKLTALIATGIAALVIGIWYMRRRSA